VTESRFFQDGHIRVTVYDHMNMEVGWVKVPVWIERRSDGTAEVTASRSPLWGELEKP
jgi:hypothetical protein